MASALLRGAYSSHGPQSSSDTTAPTPDLLERVLTALTSERGHNLVGLAVSVACRTSMQTILENWGEDAQTPGVNGGVHLHVESLVGWAASAEGERVVLNVVSTFVRQVAPNIVSSPHC